MKHHKRYSRTIFKQLLFFSVVTSILPIAIISAILFTKIEGMAEREIMDSYRQLASQYTQTIKKKLFQYEKTLALISNNTLIKEQLEQEEKGIYERGIMISGEVIKSLFLEGQDEFRNCMVYSKKESNAVYGYRVSMNDVAENEGWYDDYNGNNEKWFFYSDGITEMNSIASLVYRIEKLDIETFNLEDLGIVKLDIYINRLFAPADLDQQANSFDVLVYDDYGKLWYSSDLEKGNELPNYLKAAGVEELEEDSIVQLKDQAVFYSSIDQSGLHTVLLFDNGGFTEKKKEVQKLLLPVILILIGIVTTGAYLFARKFSKRINVLVDKFKMVETGNLAITESVQGSDEIAVLDGQFNHMLKKLDELIKKNYVQELEKKEAELKNLQLQINPHFLYNTLETISSIAAVQQIFIVCDICQKLGEIFRYSLGKNHGDFVTVEQEMHHVQNYIFIQKLRYGQKLEVFYHIEPGAEQCMLLRFILQPIVENAIVHGIGTLAGNGTLEITIERQQDVLLIKVEDDGIGMDERQKEELEAYINRPKNKKDHKKSIGVRNVNQRIKLTCGDEYGIKIDSNLHKGSSFLITLPLDGKGEEKHVSVTDC